MINCIFTLDYELYGNGTGSLNELVYEPAKRLQEIFQKWNARFVNFIEVAELRQIDIRGTDPGISDVKRQIQELYNEGIEIGLHLHPQWCNARHEKGQWILDYDEYNLCTLSRARISQIVEESLAYLREAVGQSSFTPTSFRAGNWLFQPTETVASILAENGIRIDSSVFKGGLQHNNTLDYRPAMRNGYYWPFGRDVNEPDSTGQWIEVPIYTEMVPFWEMPTSKRLAFTGGVAMNARSARQKLNRALDLLRLWYPRKLDFCRMTLSELTSTLERIVRVDRETPDVYRPIVAIGHTKDLTDPQTVDAFLSFLREKQIAVSTFEGAYSKLLRETPQTASAN
jgi:hypothetical protein